MSDPITRGSGSTPPPPSAAPVPVPQMATPAATEAGAPARADAHRPPAEVPTFQGALVSMRPLSREPRFPIISAATAATWLGRMLHLIVDSETPESNLQSALELAKKDRWAEAEEPLRRVFERRDWTRSLKAPQDFRERHNALSALAAELNRRRTSAPSPHDRDTAADRAAQLSIAAGDVARAGGHHEMAQEDYFVAGRTLSQQHIERSEQDAFNALAAAAAQTPKTKGEIKNLRIGRDALAQMVHIRARSSRPRKMLEEGLKGHSLPVGSETDLASAVARYRLDLAEAAVNTLDSDGNRDVHEYIQAILHHLSDVDRLLKRVPGDSARADALRLQRAKDLFSLACAYGRVSLNPPQRVPTMHKALEAFLPLARGRDTSDPNSPAWQVGDAARQKAAEAYRLLGQWGPDGQGDDDAARGKYRYGATMRARAGELAHDPADASGNISAAAEDYAIAANGYLRAIEAAGHVGKDVSDEEWREYFRAALRADELFVESGRGGEASDISGILQRAAQKIDPNHDRFPDVWKKVEALDALVKWSDLVREGRGGDSEGTPAPEKSREQAISELSDIERTPLVSRRLIELHRQFVSSEYGDIGNRLDHTRAAAELAEGLRDYELALILRNEEAELAFHYRNGLDPGEYDKSFLDLFYGLREEEFSARSAAIAHAKRRPSTLENLADLHNALVRLVNAYPMLRDTPHPFGNEWLAVWLEAFTVGLRLRERNPEHHPLTAVIEDGLALHGKLLEYASGPQRLAHLQAANRIVQDMYTATRNFSAARWDPDIDFDKLVELARATGKAICTTDQEWRLNYVRATVRNAHARMRSAKASNTAEFILAVSEVTDILSDNLQGLARTTAGTLRIADQDGRLAHTLAAAGDARAQMLFAESSDAAGEARNRHLAAVRKTAAVASENLRGNPNQHNLFSALHIQGREARLREQAAFSSGNIEERIAHMQAAAGAHDEYAAIANGSGAYPGEAWLQSAELYLGMAGCHHKNGDPVAEREALENASARYLAAATWGEQELLVHHPFFSDTIIADLIAQAYDGAAAVAAQLVHLPLSAQYRERATSTVHGLRTAPVLSVAPKKNAAASSILVAAADGFERVRIVRTPTELPETPPQASAIGGIVVASDAGTEAPGSAASAGVQPSTIPVGSATNGIIGAAAGIVSTLPPILPGSGAPRGVR